MSFVNRSSGLDPHLSKQVNVNPSLRKILKKKYELSKIEQKCLEALNKHLMNLANLQSYAGACEASESLREEQETLFKIIKRSKYFEHEKIAAANAISILNQTGYSFSRKNLRKIHISGAYLEGANLVGTDLEGADLTEVTLTRVMMNYARFNMANMEGVRLGQGPSIQTRGEIRSLCLSWDNQRMIVNELERIKIFDISTGQQVGILKGHSRRVMTLLSLPSENKLISGSQDKSIIVWDLVAQKQVRQLMGHTSSVVALASSSDKWASGDQEGRIIIWDRKTGDPIKPYKQFASPVKALLFSSGEKLICASKNTIYLFDIETDKEPQILDGHKEEINCLALSANGRLTSGGKDGKILVWHLAIGEQIDSFDIQTEILALLFCNNEKWLAFAGNWTVYILDLNARAVIKRFEGHTDTISSLALFRDGQRMASGGYDKVVRIWDLMQQVQISEDLPAGVTALQFFPSEKAIAVGSWNQTIRYRDSLTGKEIKRLKLKDLYQAMAFLPERRLLASVDADYTQPTIQLWDLEKGIKLTTLKGHEGRITCLDFYSHGKKLVSSGDKTLRIWKKNKASQYSCKVLSGHTNTVMTFKVYPEENILISGGWDKTIRVWNLKTLTSSHFNTNIELVTAIVLKSTSQQVIYAGTGNSSIQSYDLNRGESSQSFEGHTQGILVLALSPDEKVLVSGSLDSTLRVWNLENQKEIAAIGHSFPIHQAVFQDNPDNPLLCVSDKWGGLHMWNLHRQEDNICPELLWVTHPNLNCFQASIRQTKGLSEANQRLMIQHGAQ